MKLPGWKTFLVCEVFEVTEWKDGCVWKAHSIFYTWWINKAMYPPSKYVLANVSTSVFGDEVDLQPFKD